MMFIAVNPPDEPAGILILLVADGIDENACKARSNGVAGDVNKFRRDVVLRENAGVVFAPELVTNGGDRMVSDAQVFSAKRGIEKQECP
jgi:hypothetical protein